METVLIGKIVRPHGLQGELKVYPLTDDVRRYKQLKEVILKGAGGETKREIRRVRTDVKGMAYITLAGIESLEEAERCRGYEVHIDRAQVPPLQDRWYYFELEGMAVYENDVLLGTLLRVQETGANDIYIVRGEKGEFCVPALKTVVKKVDVPNKRMDVELPQGLLE